MSCSLKLVFISPVSVKGLFTFKGKLRKKLLSGIVYKYKCGSFNVTYYGKTKRHFKTHPYLKPIFIRFFVTISHIF